MFGRLWLLCVWWGGLMLLTVYGTRAADLRNLLSAAASSSQTSEQQANAVDTAQADLAQPAAHRSKRSGGGKVFYIPVYKKSGGSSSWGGSGGWGGWGGSGMGIKKSSSFGFGGHGGGFSGGFIGGGHGSGRAMSYLKRVSYYPINSGGGGGHWMSGGGGGWGHGGHMID